MHSKQLIRRPHCWGHFSQSVTWSKGEMHGWIIMKWNVTFSRSPIFSMPPVFLYYKEGDIAVYALFKDIAHYFCHQFCQNQICPCNTPNTWWEFFFEEFRGFWGSSIIGLLANSYWAIGVFHVSQPAVFFQPSGLFLPLLVELSEWTGSEQKFHLTILFNMFLSSHMCQNAPK